MFSLRLLTYLAGLVMLTTFGSGCTAPAQIHWSPDGTAAAYAYRDQAIVIDAEGAVLSKLGPSSGGFAWTSDGKTLYYASISSKSQDAVAAETRWQSDARRTQPPVTEGQVIPNPVKTQTIELNAWSNRKSTPLVQFQAEPVGYMALSPDQDWLAFVTGTNNDYAVYVYHLSGRRLYLLSDTAGLGLCFTGRNRLAFIEAAGNKPVADPKTVVGRIVEVTLDAKAEKLDRTPLLDVIVGETFWLAAIGDDLLMTTVARSVPGRPIGDDDMINNIKLFSWTRANNGIVAVADSAGPLFALSPDAKRVMIHKITPKNDKMPMKLELQVIYANGSGGVTLRTTKEGDPLPMWPAWRTDSQITINALEPKNESRAGEPRQVFDVTNYTLTDKGELINGKELSASWDPDLRPYEKAAATQKAN